MEESLKDANEFDNALTAAGFGAFNIYLLMVTYAGCTAMLFDSTTVAFVLPSATCDLQISLADKGYLNSITYTGMFVSVLPWAIISDTRGRKKVVIISHLLDALSVLLAACSQTTKQLIIFKFFSGFCICGGFSGLMTYISELHCERLRLRIIFITGIMLTTTSLTLPGLAVLIIPHKWEYQIYGLTFHSWHLYLACSAIPSAICGTAFIFFPESPIYHMSKGKREEALHTFQKMFALNTGHPKDEYPIKELPSRSASAAVKDPTALTILRDGYVQVKPLFTRRYLYVAIFLFFVELCVLMSQNTVRLWVPNLFSLFKEYQQYQADGRLDTSFNNTPPTLCSILEYDVFKSHHVVHNITECSVHITARSYMDNFVVGVVAIFTYIPAFFVAPVLGAKRVLSISLLFSAIFGYIWYFSDSEVIFTAVVSLYLAMENISSSSLLNSTVSYFPTQMRNMVVSFTFMFGRIGSVIGNNVFPILVSSGCFSTSFCIGSVALATFLVSFLLPNPSDVPFT